MKPRIVNDAAAGCYRAILPDGYRFSSGPHELVSWYEGERSFMREAREDLAISVANDDVEPCRCEDCEWCDR